MKDDARPSYWKMGMEELWCFPRQGAWILAISREIARLDQWRIVPKKDLWAVAGAWKELAGVVGRPRKRPHSGNEKNARVGTAVVINDQKRQVGRSALRINLAPKGPARRFGRELLGGDACFGPPRASNIPNGLTAETSAQLPWLGKLSHRWMVVF